MYGNPYMTNAFSPYGYGAQSAFTGQPNNFASSQFGQPQSSIQAQPGTGINVAQVATIEQVEQVQLMPGEKKIILVQNAPVMAIRIADQMGLVQTEYRKMEVFDPHQSQTTNNTAEYAPLSEVEQLKLQINQLYQELNEIKGGISHGKPSKQSVSSNNSAAGTTSE